MDMSKKLLDTTPASSFITIPLEQNRNRLMKIDLPADLRILIVEDEYFYQCLFKSLMYKWQVRIAENGLIALDILRKHSFDLIVMDIEMPVLDGYETAKAIRNEMGIKIPIIAVSGTTDPSASEKIIEAGMNDFLPKPYYSATLYMKILKTLGIDMDRQD